MRRRPSLTTPCVADHYCDKRTERIAEFDANDGTGTGGLIQLRRLESGTLLVNVYRIDGPVEVEVTARNGDVLSRAKAGQHRRD